jgi:thiol reductant ABC exporter CydC subunit
MSTKPPGDIRRLAASAGRPATTRLLFGALIGAAALLAGVGLTATAAWLIARASQHPPILTLTVAIVAVRFFGVARPVLRYVERLVSHDSAFRVLADVRARVYSQLVLRPPAVLASRRRGDLLAGVAADVDAVEDLHLGVLEPAAVAALVSASVVVLVAWLLPSAGLVLAAAFLVAGVLAPWLAARAARQATAVLAPRRAQLSASVVELLRGAPDLTALGVAERWLADADALDADLTSAARRAAWATGLGAGISALAAGAAVWASAVLGVHGVSTGRLPGLALGVVVLIPLVAFEALVPLPRAAVLVGGVKQAARRLFGVLDQSAAYEAPGHPSPLPEGPYTLRLSQVRARWAVDGPAVLDGLDLELAPSRRVAITGVSGSGKSTVAALLLRFLPAQSGSITINGTDVADLSPDDVRRVVGLVDDDPHIFDSNLRANLALARPAAPDEELIAALRRVRLGDWYDGLPAGLETWLGERGGQISGGERRRIGLARALLADLPVIVLDEPTEGLDAATAEAVMADLLDATSGRSVVLLAHRPEGLALVDQVYELRAGRLEPVAAP